VPGECRDARAARPDGEVAAQNPIARLVKLADLEDNMDLSRIAQPTARDYARLEKYKAAKVVIEKAIAGVA
jgi:guanosine-3',5'-bis(diphosphate) 3'-pyrophosphohydrolase